MLVPLFAALLVLSSPVWSGPTGDASSARLKLDSELDVWILKHKLELQEMANSQPSQQLNQRSKTRNNTYNYIVEYGYPGETHSVHTDDGYILSVIRLANPGKPAVFLQHGLFSSAADFVVLGPNRSLAFVLFDAGFDVWLCNSRGTTESRSHETLNPDKNKSKFWDFSWHEMGISDLPASIDYVLNVTEQTKLHFIGHSQGTTTFFVLGAEKPEYMQKIKTFTAMAPIAYLRDIRSDPLLLLAKLRKTLGLASDLLQIDEILPNSPLIKLITSLVCANGAVTQEAVCSNVFFLFYGFDQQQMNETILPEILKNIPAGASTKQLLHYSQLIDTNKLIFRKYDYDSLKNKKLYGSRTPPEYDLTGVTAPTYLVYADNDLLSVSSNIEELRQKLPNIAEGGLRRVAFDKFNHIDFLFAIDAKKLVYDDIIKSFQEYETSQLQ